MKETDKNYQSARVGLLGRFPLTTVVVLLYLCINAVTVVVYEIANFILKSGNDAAYILILPMYVLTNLSHAVLIGGGIVTIAVDVLRFNQNKTLGKLQQSVPFNLAWIILILLLLPTYTMYRDIFPHAMGQTIKDFQFAIFASPQQRINDRLKRALKTKYNRQEIEFCLKHGADINTCASDGGTALNYAAHAADEEFVNELLALGANVNAVKKDGTEIPAIESALDSGYEKDAPYEASSRIIQTLIKNGSVLRTRDNPFIVLNTALHTKMPKKTIEFLLNAGCPLDSTSGKTNSPIPTPLMTASEMGDNKTIGLLLDHGANINAIVGGPVTENASGFNALHYALQGEHLETVKYLIAHGIDAKVKNAAGASYVVFAAVKKSPEYLHELLKACAPISGHSISGDNALSNAVKTGDVNRVRLLISRGATIDLSKPIGQYTLIAAEQQHNPEMNRLIHLADSAKLPTAREQVTESANVSNQRKVDH